MGTTTQHLGLFKPGDEDFQDVAKIADAFQRIDDYLRSSDNFIPIPLGNNTTEWNANWTTAFGFIPSYVDRGDHYLLRGVAQRAGTTPPNIANGEVVGRLPSTLPASQYFTAGGAGGSVLNLQINTAGNIVMRAAAVGLSSWVSLDNITVWKV
jgi:hypothetical protein